MINLVKSPNIVWRDRPIGTRGSQSVSRMYQHSVALPRALDAKTLWERELMLLHECGPLFVMDLSVALLFRCRKEKRIK